MNYYEVLQIKNNASSQEIKQAYRKLAKKYHPDSQNDFANHEEIIRLNAAYEVLNNPEQRHQYDRTLGGNSVTAVKYREEKSNDASRYYQENRQRRRNTEVYQTQWLNEVYYPINQLINSIIEPLEMEIEELSADVFDDELMDFFLGYLARCNETYYQAKNLLASQPNPSLYAGIAQNLYYSLNHVSDGLEELNRFTQTYDETYLHTGRELFNLADETSILAREMVEKFI